jgi:hypothetical protein
MFYEKQVLLGLSQIYYCLYIYTCHHYTNVIKMVKLKLEIYLQNVEGTSLIKCSSR